MASSILAIAAFAEVFKVDKKVAETPEVQRWIDEALDYLVEVEMLRNETRQDADARRRMSNVLYGEIDDLALHLRRLYPEYGKFTKWQIIFKVFSEIKDVTQMIEEAVRQTEEEVPIESDTSIPEKEEVSMIDSGTSTEVKDEVDTSTYLSEQPSGNPESEEDKSLSINQSTMSNKEDKEMANATNALDDLQEQATGSKPQATATLSADEVINSMDIEARTLYVQQHSVTKLVVPNEPTMLRLNQAHPVMIGKDKASCKKALAENWARFEAATGYMKVNGHSDDKPVTEWFPRLVKKDANGATVPDGEACESAKRILTLLEELSQNNEMILDIYAPKKTAYSVKGFQLDNADIYTVAEMQALMCDQTNGHLYAANAISNGKPVAGGCELELVVTKQTKSTKSTNGQAKTTTTTSKAAIRVKKKDDFAVGNKIIVYPTADPNNMGTDMVMKTVKLTVGVKDESGAIVPASFKYPSTKEEIAKKEKNGKSITKDPKSTFTLKCYAQAIPSYNTSDAELGGKTADAFGKPYGEKKAQEAVDWTDPRAARESLSGTKTVKGKTVRPAFVNLMMQVANGSVVIDGSTAAADIKQKAVDSQTAANNDAADDMKEFSE